MLVLWTPVDSHSAVTVGAGGDPQMTRGHPRSHGFSPRAFDSGLSCKRASTAGSLHCYNDLIWLSPPGTGSTHQVPPTRIQATLFLQYFCHGVPARPTGTLSHPMRQPPPTPASMVGSLALCFQRGWSLNAGVLRNEFWSWFGHSQPALSRERFLTHEAE